MAGRTTSITSTSLQSRQHKSVADRWLRWYDGTTRDGKFRIVADMSDVPVCTVIGVWASILEDAATSDPRGFVTRGIEYHSMYLDIADSEIEKIWNGLERVGTLRNTGNGKERSTVFEVLNWDKRQFETDAKDPTAKDRKERWKKAHRDMERSGTLRNGLEHQSQRQSTDSETD